jgi:hypothetical protein
MGAGITSNHTLADHADFAEIYFCETQRNFRIECAICGGVNPAKYIFQIDAFLPRIRKWRFFPRILPAEALSDKKENNPNNAIHRMATRVTPRAWARSSPGTSRATGSHR